MPIDIVDINKVKDLIKENYDEIFRYYSKSYLIKDEYKNMFSFLPERKEEGPVVNIKIPESYIVGKAIHLSVHYIYYDEDKNMYYLLYAYPRRKIGRGHFKTRSITRSESGLWRERIVEEIDKGFGVIEKLIIIKDDKYNDGYVYYATANNDYDAKLFKSLIIPIDRIVNRRDTKDIIKSLEELDNNFPFLKLRDYIGDFELITEFGIKEAKIYKHFLNRVLKGDINLYLARRDIIIEKFEDDNSFKFNYNKVFFEL